MTVRRIRINEPRRIARGNVSITVRSRPIEHVFDESEIAAGPAAAIRDAIAEGIRGITKTIAPATRRYRAEARRAVARGASWALERYAGRQPSSSDRMFNDSGELAGEVELRQVADGTFQIVAPADRLNAPGAAPMSLLERLRELVPALQDPFEVPAVKAAIEATWAKIVRRG